MSNGSHAEPLLDLNTLTTEEELQPGMCIRTLFGAMTVQRDVVGVLYLSSGSMVATLGFKGFWEISGYINLKSVEKVRDYVKEQESGSSND